MILEYKGITIFYTDKGKGDCVVLLHGFLENSNMWNDLIPEVSKKNRVISIDLLGHGKTGCLGYVHTMELMAEVIDVVLKHLKIKKTHLIGHSMGGYVALAFAEKNPSKVKGLCLMNSTPTADDKERRKNRDRAIIAVKQNHQIFIQLAISNLFRPKNRRIFSEKIKDIKEEALHMPLQGIIAALEGMKIRKNRDEFFKNSGFKKMMVIGRKDPVLECTTLLNIAKNSNAEIVEFPDGHMSHIENKKDFTYKIIHYIEK
jgi:pimeloyl-ACP methyl ester carboxylesterase